MRILLSGPPSSGKSTQGRRLAAILGIPHVSSGDLIRSAAAKGDPRDVDILRSVSDGSLAPSDVIVHMVASRLALPDCAHGFLLDGFPRRPFEAAFITASFRIDALLVMEADQETLLERVRSRAAAGRPDDDPAHFPRRIHAFETETRGAHCELALRGVPVLAINAAGSKEVTAAGIDQVIESLLAMKCQAPRFA